MVGLLGNPLPPGLAGFVTQRQLAGQEQMQNMAQAQGLLGMQQAMTQQQQAQKEMEFKGLLGQKLQTGDQEGAKQVLMQWKPELFASGLAPKAPSWKETALKNPDGTVKRGYVDINSPTPEATFRPLGVEPVKQEFINGVGINPYTQNQPIPSGRDPFTPQPDGKGGFNLVPNEPVQKFKLGVAAAGAPRVNVSTEKKYGEMFAGKVADNDVQLMDTARKAPALAERANNIRDVLDSGKVITGMGADYRLALGKALNLTGTDNEVISNTEVLATDLARNTLDSIKASGLGSGSGFSNADRDFLEKAAGGKINLEANTIRRLADLSYKAAEGSANTWNKRVQNIPESALAGTGIERSPIQVPTYAPKKNQPNATLTPAERQELEALRKRFGAR